jgi:hypothetical protein
MEPPSYSVVNDRDLKMAAENQQAYPFSPNSYKSSYIRRFLPPKIEKGHG